MPRGTEEALLREILADPGLARILTIFRERWVRYGRTAGRVRLESWDEVHAVSALTGSQTLRPGSILTAETLEAALRETRFGCDLRYALEIHFEEPIVTLEERREAKRRAWEETRASLERILDEAPIPVDTRTRLRSWLVDDTRELQRRHTQDPARLLREFGAAVRAIAHLPGPDRPDKIVALAVLATRALGDPHALDANAPAASLFDRALAHLHPEVADAHARGAEGRDELLAAAGIARDRTSPKVDAFGLLSADPGLAWLTEHPLTTFTLRALEALRGRGLHAARNTAFVVENPAVFDQIVERLAEVPADERPTVVCTNGWLNLADRLLLRELTRNGTRIRYSGDFDANGLAIAATVLHGFAPAAELWRMTPNDYLAALGAEGPMLDANAFRTGARIAPDLVQEMQRHGRAAYQEAILGRLMVDLGIGRTARGGR